MLGPKPGQPPNKILLGDNGTDICCFSYSESIAEASTSIGRNDESSDSDSGSDGPTTPTDEPEEKFKCKFCRMKYSSARSYYNHINVHGNLFNGNEFTAFKKPIFYSTRT